MSTYNYRNTYELERQRRRASWEQAPKECPHCKARNITTSINQEFSEYGNERPRYHCGSEACRAAASRVNRKIRRKQERAQVSAAIDQYVERLKPEQRHTLLEVRKLLARYSKGHTILWQLIEIIEDRACKHDKIQILIENAALEKRRADKAEQHAKELEALYQRRIAELQEEITIYQTLENAIHGIATSQLRKQFDQEPQPLPQPSLALQPNSTRSVPAQGQEDGERDDEDEQE